MNDLNKALASFKEPTTKGPDGKIEKIPYFAFWRPVKRYADGQDTEDFELTHIMAVGSHCVPTKVDQYAKKEGWKLVKFYFPDLPQFQEIREHCELLTRGDKKITELEGEKAALAEKVAALQAKLRGEK